MNHLTITPNATKLNGYQTVLNPLETEQEQQGDFTSALAHEIRNPLASINLAVQMLKSLISDEHQKTYLDIILRSSGRVSNIVADFLTHSRGVEMQREKHSIHQLLDEVLSMTEDRIILKNITVSKDYANKDCKIVMNRPKMKIALTNIVINAIEAMSSEKGQLTLATKSMDSKYVIEIEDNGTGISENDLKSIFQPYFSRKAGGMGLGLSTTLDILSSNYVRLDVQSEEGRGTRFMLFFDKKSG